jgi:thiamine pyrophosphokinase
MNRVIVQSLAGVTLVGGGPVSKAELAFSRQFAPLVVAADGGADHCLRNGLLPEAVIGDFDSISLGAQAVIPASRLHRVADQETTDFDKALRLIAAPFVLALGFVGARIDHGLAVFNALVRLADRPCIVIGPRDVVFHAPAKMQLQMRVGDRVSLFPMAPVTGRSTGLHWPIDGIAFAPAGQVGTSNRASARQVDLAFDGPGMLVILPRARLDQAIAVVQDAP